MGLSASQGRLLLLTARRSDLEYRAQQISQKRLMLAQQLESIALDYETATTNKQMKIQLYLDGSTENKESQQTLNLTYARLVSGAVAAGQGNSGLKRSKEAGTDDLEYSSTQAYRLKDADGNIVVSSEDEIPTKVCMPTVPFCSEKADGTSTTLADLIKNKNNEYEVDTNNNLLKVNGIIYDINSGEKYSSDSYPHTPAWTPAADVKFEAKGNKTSGNVISDQSSYTKKSLGNGRFGLVNGKGEILNGMTYVVDKSLKGGGSDPNYLQDAIRYGRYSIEKGYISGDTNEYTWTDVSWESMTNLYDSNYIDDDEAAQAKYDRLQAEIQNEDKKLELELDNIETQRSAVTTEIESVQKVIDDNIESTFKIFS